MRILFTGGGTGGHFYPIISIAQELNTLVQEKRLIQPELYFMSVAPYDAGLLHENRIIYVKNSAGKLRKYFSIQNFFDAFKTLWGVAVSLYELYKIYPDVVFGKGGYTSFPALLAARILRIPVVIHESDTVPGRVNLWAGKFAQRIAVSYADAAKHFPQDKVAHTGNPVRSDIATPKKGGAREHFALAEDLPVILVLGGSQGAERINEAILAALPKLLNEYQVLHQTGKRNFQEVSATADAILFNHPHKDRYKPLEYLDTLSLRHAAGIASVVISRAGSTIFEIASWKVPAIIIPISERVSRDQRSNAFAYARAGAGVVVEEDNLSANILFAEVPRINSNKDVQDKMRQAAEHFYKPDASRLVAEEILKIALAHELGKEIK